VLHHVENIHPSYLLRPFQINGVNIRWNCIKQRGSEEVLMLQSTMQNILTIKLIDLIFMNLSINAMNIQQDWFHRIALGLTHERINKRVICGNHSQRHELWKLPIEISMGFILLLRHLSEAHYKTKRELILLLTWEIQVIFLEPCTQVYLP
jgi:hypothetical protein